ncbi:ABC transporter permease [Nocardioides immobilis]|uniref:ABC transporter permease n=1 Tax=Nocardioides immobilis TaxID=2049295 RepID=A0A417Y499_9ACTN|nr:ABC transporter permease [Nocardioides immobilis]RHW27492.1 ABC transporter permease [Nocardioides immobilis]
MANSTLTTPPTRKREPWHLSAPPSHRPNIFLATVRNLLHRHWTFEVGAALLLFVLLVLVLTPWIAPHDPANQDLANRLAGPSADHWLGTDHLGRDVLSRLMWGGRFSVTIAGITLVICVVSGTILGALAGRRGGWIDEVVMRTVDVLVCFPDVVIALFLIALFGTGYGTLIAALSIAGWTPFARLMRGLALEINAKEYIEAAEILGSPKWFILFRHVIPNALPPVAAMSFLRFGHKLITVGALSYLSLGVQPPDSDWGAMLLDAQPYMERAPWVGILPGAAIFITALSVTMIGQGLDVQKKRRTTARTTGPSGAPAEEPASRTAIEEGEAL